MNIVQLDFFQTEEQSEIAALRHEIVQVKESSDKVRRGLFARHNELQKFMEEINSRLSIIEKHICTQK